MMLFAAALGASIFGAHERSNVDKLYGVLPLTRREMVIGRYLYALLLGLATVALSIVLTFAAGVFTRAATDWRTFAFVTNAAFVYYCFSAAVSFPIYFKIAFSKANIYTMLPMTAIFAGGVYLIRNNEDVENAAALLRSAAQNPGLTAVICLLVGIMLLGVSGIVSCWFRKNKEL
jgi:ABC-type transport system involved in multi-copper enzyme maturation permease subunit